MFRGRTAETDGDPLAVVPVVVVAAGAVGCLVPRPPSFARVGRLTRLNRL